LAAESAERAPGGIVVVDLELRRALEPQSVDFGQVELSIAGELARIHFEHGLPVARKLGLPALARGIVFTPDGQELIASSFDGLIHVFDVASGAETRQIVPPDDVAPLTILPLRGLLVAGGADFSGHCPLYVFDLASGAVLQELAGHRSAVQALCVSPDGTQLASAGSEGIIKVWDTSGWTCVRRIDCNVQDAESSAILRGVAFSPDGRQIAGFGGQKAGGADWNTPLVRIWDIASGELVSELAGGHSDSMLCGRFSAEGKTLYTASSDRTARAWDLATGAELRRIESSHPLYGVGFSPDGKTLVLCDGELRFFDTATFASDSALGDSAAQLDVSRFVFSPDGRMLATDGGGVLYLWDLSAR
jgi:WD40 repeat protein